MPDVIHIVDRFTPLDMQRQLDSLAAPQEPIVSFGPPPPYLSARRTIRHVSQPPPPERLTSRLQEPPFPDAPIVHFWTPRPPPGRDAYPKARCVLSLPALPEGEIPFHHAAILTVPTPPAATGLVRRGVPVTNVAVLAPAAADVHDRQVRRQMVRDELALTDENFLLLAPGEMIRAAGHKYAPWVQAILLQMLPNVRLLIPGSGPYAEHVRRFADNTGRGDTVFFTGDRWPLEDCLCAADAAIMLHQRDCGIATLAAAMACRLPIVASETPDIAWCAPAGRAALLVPPRSPRLAAGEIMRLIDDPQLARRLGDAAGARAAEIFDIEQSRRARLAIYAGKLPLP